MSEHLTLLAFLERSDRRVRVFDMGRRVRELVRAEYLAFENSARPYPLPLQRKAWIALAHAGQDDPHNPVLWFLRLDLDEQGKLVQAGRDYILQRLLEDAAKRIESHSTIDALQDNPFVFKPRDDRLAVLHALLGVALQQPPSRFFTHAMEYFQGEPGWEQWRFVGYQGIADVAVRCTAASDIAAHLTTAIPHLPAEPLDALCQCLEHIRCPAPVAAALLMRLEHLLRDPTAAPDAVAMLLRGLAQAQDHALTQRAVALTLAHPCGHSPETLAAIAGRAWETLTEPGTAMHFLSALAANDQGQTVFEHCLTDLFTLPGMREPLLACLRSPSRPAAVATAFQRMTTELGHGSTT